MKLYIANGQYVGTQADAKRLDKQFNEIDVPVDKPGLIAFLNRRVELRSDLAQIDADQPVKDINEDIDPRLKPGKVVSYTETAVKLDELVANSPLPQRLTWASLALEDARTKLFPVEEKPVLWRAKDGKVEEAALDDDALFG